MDKILQAPNGEIMVVAARVAVRIIPASGMTAGDHAALANADVAVVNVKGSQLVQAIAASKAQPLSRLLFALGHDAVERYRGIHEPAPGMARDRLGKLALVEAAVTIPEHAPARLVPRFDGANPDDHAAILAMILPTIALEATFSTSIVWISSGGYSGNAAAACTTAPRRTATRACAARSAPG